MKPRAVQLLSVTLDGYRSCKNTSFALSTHVSALIGLNGSGKTNILHGLRLLRAVGRLRGRASAVVSRCRVKAEYRVNGKRVRYRALVTVGQDLRGREEVIRARELWNFKELTGVDSWIDLPSRFIRDPYYFSLARRRTGLKQRHAAYWMPERDIKRSPLPRRVLAAVQRIASFNATITYYSVAQFTDPSRSPTSFELDSDGDLRTNQPGEHTTFLHGLHQTYKNDRQEYEDFISLVGPKGIGLIHGIEWKEIIVKSREVRVRSGGQVVSEPQRRTIVIPLVSIDSRTKLAPNQLSEGTFKTLALLFYLLTSRARLMLIEEPEVCVHHGLLASIISVIKACARRKQIVFSTHSDFVLDALQPEDVHLVQYKPAKGTTVKSLPRTLSKSGYGALKEYLSTSGNLGEYWRHGGLE